MLIVLQKGAVSFSPSGILSILVAAFAESLIYIIYKSKYEPNEFQGLFHLYCGGLIAVLIARATNLIEPFDYKPEIWQKLTLFNTFVGFIAFSLIAYSIPFMPPELFASLAFFGVISAYIFGEIGKEVRPSIPTVLGTILILIGAAAVRYLKIDTKG
jgi:drug/metabolite transporter (DMT)-like permease